MAKNHMESCSTSLVVREMGIKTAVRYHLIPTRMTVMKKTGSNSIGKEGCGEMYFWWEYKIAQLLWETLW